MEENKQFNHCVTNVRIKPGFWDDRLRLNRDISISHAYRQLQAAGNLDAFRMACEARPAAEHSGFRDSDVAKWIEAASHSLITHPDADLQQLLNAVVERVVSAQQSDGYLNTYYTIMAPDQRWRNLRDNHELYCAGHLMEAAVAHFEATGKRTLLDAMCRYADYIGTAFGYEKGQLRGYPGHEEIELALVKLAHATGERRYIDLASYFVDERGQQPCYFDHEAAARGEDPEAQHPHRQAGERYAYYQAHRPVREQDTAEGHAVRAGYLYAGMVDVAVETEDDELLAACSRIWRNIVERRLYIHGGIGSDPTGERFSVDYDLPNLTAYAETCASIALVFFAHRLLQNEPHREYADVIERSLYNSILACASRDGTRFFYANRLACQPDVMVYGNRKHEFRNPPDRQPWFGTACCPTNLTRFLPTIGRYIYSEKPETLWVHQFINSKLETDVAGGAVRLMQQSDYPWEGQITFTVESRSSATFMLCLRIPGWCRKAMVGIDGGTHQPVEPDMDGYVKIKRDWAGTTSIVLDLDMPVERIKSHPAVRHNAGRVALQRGPVLYCFEEVDNGTCLHDMILPIDSEIRLSDVDTRIGSEIPGLTASGLRRDPSAWQGKLYTANPSPRIPCTLQAIPYYLWNNRDSGEMIVWIQTGNDDKRDNKASQNYETTNT